MIVMQRLRFPSHQNSKRYQGPGGCTSAQPCTSHIACRAVTFNSSPLCRTVKWCYSKVRTGQLTNKFENKKINQRNFTNNPSLP